MSTSAQTNAAGLTAEESKRLAPRQPNSDESVILQSVKELYSCKPTTETYDIYTRNAQFQDPIGIANGLDSIKAQFNGLAKIFAKATVHKIDLLTNPSSIPSSTLLINQDVEYHLKESSQDGDGIKTLNSLLTIERDSQGKVTKHTEEWDHKKTTGAADGGFFAKLDTGRKKLTAALVDAAVGKEPPKKSEL